MSAALPLRACLLLAATILASPARADFYLVVQTGSSQHALTQKEAVALYMGHSRAFANGDFAQVFDLRRDNPARASFYKALTGMSEAQVNSYWSRLMFSGRSLPPPGLPDESAVMAAVKRDPKAIGWLSKEPGDKQLRTVLVLKDDN